MRRTTLIAFMLGTPVATGALAAAIFWWMSVPMTAPEPMPLTIAPAPMVDAVQPAPEPPAAPIQIPAVAGQPAATAMPEPGAPMLDPKPALDPTPADPTPVGPAVQAVDAATHGSSESLAGAPLPQ